MSQLIQENIKIQIGSGSMGGYLARPATQETLPAVLVFQEIFGVNSHIRDVTDRVASEGYVALAPDYFWRTAPGIELKYDDEGMKIGVGNLQKLQAEEILTDVNASLAFLRARSDVRGDRIGCMGFCIGGHVAYLAACETDVAATASFYGGGITAFRPGGGTPTVSLTPNIRGRILCLFGGKDPLISSAQVSQMKTALSDASIKHDIVVYPNATHGFFCDQRGAFHRPSREDAWARTRALFASTLQK